MTESSRGETVIEAVRPLVGERVLTGGWFHPVADVRLSGSGWVDLLRVPLLWVARRRRSGLPAHSYWVVTESRLYVFELRFGTTQRVHRTVLTCGRGAVTARRLDNPYS